MPQAIKDFPSIAPNQTEQLVFDMGPYLPTGVTLSGTPLVTCQVSAVRNGATDPSPSGRVSNVAIGTAATPDGSGKVSCAVVCDFAGGVDNVTYVLEATCMRSDGYTAELWGHLLCRAPNPVV